MQQQHEHWRGHVALPVCAHAWVCTRLCLCVYALECVCVCEREREREREMGVSKPLLSYSCVLSSRRVSHQALAEVKLRRLTCRHRGPGII